MQSLALDEQEKGGLEWARQQFEIYQDAKAELKAKRRAKQRCKIIHKANDVRQKCESAAAEGSSNLRLRYEPPIPEPVLKYLEDVYFVKLVFKFTLRGQDQYYSIEWLVHSESE